MSWLHRLFKRRADAELDEEIRFHLAQEVQLRIDRGESRQGATGAAQRAFGNTTLVKELTREMWGLIWVEDLLRDVRHALRGMRRAPTFTSVAVLSLALGIGANTAIFSLIDAVSRVLPVERPEELVAFSIPSGRGSFGFSYPLFEALRDHNQVLSGMFAVAGATLSVTANGQSEIAAGGGQFVSGSYFSTLGVKAIAGRTFTPEEDHAPGEHPVAVISYGYWKRRFALDPSVIGKSIDLNGHPFTIIGVTPRRFFGTAVGASPDVTVPMMMYSQLNLGSTQLTNRGSWWLHLMGRLKPGTSAAQAAAGLNVAFQQYLAETGGETQRSFLSKRIELEPGGHGMARQDPAMRTALLAVMGAVGLVLLIACANVANLLLARSAARRKEISMRLSLGASRLRLIRQLLTESMLLAWMGGGLGLLFAYWGDQGLLHLVHRGPAAIPIELNPDSRILAFTAAISALTGLLFGIVPALNATRLDLSTSMKLAFWSRRLVSPSQLLVSFQVALSLLLLIGAGLFVRTLHNLKTVDLGFSPQKVMVISIDPTLIGYKGGRIAALYKDLLEKLEATPGVRSATLSSNGLVSGNGWQNQVTVPGYVAHKDEPRDASFSPVGPRFFETIGMPILLGRDFTSHDNERAPKVAVLSDSLSRHYFGDQNPLGRTIGLGVRQNMGQFEIIGVAKDAKYGDLHEPPQHVVYFPLLQMPLQMVRRVMLEVSTAADPTSMTATLRRDLLSVEKNLPIYSVETLAAQVDNSLMAWELIASLASLFSSLALLLASVGLYGVISYKVQRRTPEIGIRMALGAQTRTILWMVLREVLVLLVIGIALGIAAALASLRLVRGLLFGLTPTDAPTIAVATAILIAVALLAGYLPARRASRVDPNSALRYE